MPGSGVSLGSARGSIVIDITSLAAAEARARSAGKNISTSLGAINTGAKAAQTGVSGLSNGFGALAGSIGQAVVAYGLYRAAVAAFDMGKQAAINDRTRGSFDALTASVGVSGNSMMASMRKASKGMIADQQLVVNANQAILLKVADTTAEMTDLLNASRVLGQAMGKDVASSFNDLVLGLGRLSPRILDNLGIANEGEKTFENYAASIGRTAESLSDAEKMQALMNQVMKAAKPLLEAEAKSGDSAANEFERLATAMANAKQSAGDFLLTIGLTDTVDTFTRSINDSADQLEWLAKKYAEAKAAIAPLTNIFGGDPTQTLRGQIAGLENMRSHLTEGRAGLTDPTEIARQDALLAQVNSELGRFNAQLMSATGELARRTIQTDLAPPFRPSSTAAGVRSDPQTAIIQDWADGVREIERTANSARLDATQSYEAQRTSTIRSYEQGIAREAQDFAIGRARAAKQLADSIADIQSDGAKNGVRWAADLAERIAALRQAQGTAIAELVEAGNKRLADIEEQYRTDRERAERDHRDRLFSAASRLDAVAVAEEQRSFARAASVAAEDHAKQVSDESRTLAERISQEQTNLQERIAQEQAAHAERLADAKAADEQRIADLIESQAEQQAQEDADRALRLARQAEDYQAQLAEMAAAQAERIAQIERHAAEERAQLDEEAKKALAAEGLVNREFFLQQVELKKKSLELFENWWKRINYAFENSMIGPPTPAESARRAAEEAKVHAWPGFANGGFVGRTGLATVHQGEYVLSRKMLQAGGATRSNVVNIASGAIAVYAAEGMSAEAIADAVNRRLIAHYREISN